MSLRNLKFIKICLKYLPLYINTQYNYLDAKRDDKDKCKFLSQQFTLKRFNLMQDREKYLVNNLR